MAHSFKVSTPDSFVFTKPNEWPKWIRRFERYRLASGLDGKPDAMQVNALVYAMGDEADDIMAVFGLTEEEREVYQTVKTKFDEHFVVRRNTIFERAKFNRRCQEEGENVDSYITSLFCLAEHCEYGALHDDMIRDRTIVGIVDSALSLKLQLDAMEAIGTQCRADICFKLDTGAYVTVISQSDYRRADSPSLDASTKRLVGANDNVLQALGKFNGRLSQGGAVVD